MHGSEVPSLFFLFPSRSLLFRHNETPMSRSYIMLRSPHFTSSTNVPASSIPPVATTWSHLFQGAALRSFRGLGKLCSLQPYQRLWKGIENCLRNLIGGIPPSTLLLNIYLFYFFIYLYLFKKHKKSVFHSKN